MMKNKVVYPVIILKNKKDYIVNVPDLNLFTEGKSMVDAIDMSRDVIGLHCMGLIDMKKRLPKASTYEEAYKICKKRNREYIDGVMTMVDVDVDKYRETISKKTIRRNVSIPEYLNDVANKSGINVSKILTAALVKELGLTE